MAITATTVLIINKVCPCCNVTVEAAAQLRIRVRSVPIVTKGRFLNAIGTDLFVKLGGFRGSDPLGEGVGGKDRSISEDFGAQGKAFPL